MALRQTKVLSFVLVAIIAAACGASEPVTEPPCTTGEGGASSSSSSGEGGAGGEEPPIVCDYRAECSQLAEWCTSVYIWPNTWKLMQKYGEPHCYCVCNPGGSQCSKDPHGSKCGFLKRDTGTGELENFFPDNNGIFQNGFPNVCLFDEVTPSMATLPDECP